MVEEKARHISRGYEGPDSDREWYIKENAVAMVKELEETNEKLRKRITLLEKGIAAGKQRNGMMVAEIEELRAIARIAIREWCLAKGGLLTDDDERCSDPLCMACLTDKYWRKPTCVAS
jgi:hypothetical protein